MQSVCNFMPILNFAKFANEYKMERFLKNLHFTKRQAKMKIGRY